MKATTKFLKKTFKRSSRGGSQQDDDSSRRSSRRRSVSEMGSSDSDRSIRRDQNLSGLRGCSSRFSVEVNDVLEPPRRPRTRSHSKAQAPEEMNIDDEDERWNYSPEGFSLRTSIEEQRYNSCLKRITSNFDLDFDFMTILDFTPSIEKAFSNLGWSNFIHFSAVYQEDIALEIMTTMDIIQSSDLVHSFRFRLKETWTEIPFGFIGSVLGFLENAPESIEVTLDTLEKFWLQVATDSTKERMKIVNPIIRIIHRYMANRVLERLDDTKVQLPELKWLYVALCQPTGINPISSMINHWITQRNRSRGSLGFGHYLTMIAASLVPRLVFNPIYTKTPADIDENSLRKGKYSWQFGQWLLCYQNQLQNS